MLRFIYKISPLPLRRLWERAWNNLNSFVNRDTAVYKQESTRHVIRADSMSVAEFESVVVAKLGENRILYFIDHVIDWESSLFQRPQHMAMGMANLGYFVIYQSNEFENRVVQVADGVWVFPFFPSNFDPRRAVRVRYSTSPLVQSHDPRSLSVFEYVDHITSEISAGWTNLLRENKTRLLEKSDIVIATSETLHEEVRSQISQTTVSLKVTNGADVDHFTKPYSGLSPSDQSSIELIKEMQSQYEITCGYYGAIAPWLWMEEISTLVNENPDIMFLWIGPDYNSALEKLPRSDNSIHIPAVNYEVLPNYSSLFDVGIIPFKPGLVAQTTSPLKLFEYFSSGLPTVVTNDMRECVQFEGSYAASNAQEFAKQIRVAKIAKKDLKEKLLENANRNSWRSKAQQVHEAVSTKMKERL